MPSEIMRGGVSVPTPEPDHLAIAEESLLAKEDSLKRQLAHIQGVIANLRSERGVSSGEPPEVTVHAPVKKDEYRGYRAAEAMESYLRSRPGKIPLSTIVKDMVFGGAEPGARRSGETDIAKLTSWNLRIAIGAVNSRFDFHPKKLDKKTGKMKIPKKVPNEQVMVWLSEAAAVPKKRTYSPKPCKK